MTVSRRTKKELARFFGITLGVQFVACFSVVLFSKQIGGLLSAICRQPVPAFAVLYLGALERGARFASLYDLRLARRIEPVALLTIPTQ